MIICFADIIIEVPVTPKKRPVFLEYTYFWVFSEEHINNLLKQFHLLTCSC